MAVSSNDSPRWSADWERAVRAEMLRGGPPMETELHKAPMETELHKAMKLGTARRRFIRSLFPADWQFRDDQYSFVEGRAILMVTVPLFPR